MRNIATIRQRKREKGGGGKREPILGVTVKKGGLFPYLLCRRGGKPHEGRGIEQSPPYHGHRGEEKKREKKKYHLL